MAKFCVYCGGPLNPDGNCPKCAAKRRAGNAASPAPDAKPAARPAADSAKHPAAPKSSAAKKPDPKSKKKKSPVLPIVLISLAVLILAFIALCALQYFKVVNIPFVGKLLTSIGLQKEEQKGEEAVPDIEELTVPEASERLTKFGTIVSQSAVTESGKMHTEAEAIAFFRDRGFTQYAVTTDYAADGSFIDEITVTEQSNARHPVYTTIYVTSSGAQWTISEVNGQIYAVPVTYNLEGSFTVEHILSETDTFVSFDSATGTFYEISPNRSEIVLKKVGRIDASTLETMTAEEVNR